MRVLPKNWNALTEDEKDVLILEGQIASLEVRKAKGHTYSEEHLLKLKQQLKNLLLEITQN